MEKEQIKYGEKKSLGTRENEEIKVPYGETQNLETRRTLLPLADICQMPHLKFPSFSQAFRRTQRPRVSDTQIKASLGLVIVQVSAEESSNPHA